jgi:LDH2 family malate/lactate/ureidoglycolate dehydrogenase
MPVCRMKKQTMCASIHTQSSCDGIYSHGLNRVEKFIKFIEKNWVDVNAEPSLDKSLGVMENIQWSSRSWHSECTFRDGQSD